MDPLEKVHEHVHELIFQHLTVDEVLDTSLVSRKWYKVVGKSSNAMKKVWLNVGDRFNEPKKEDLRAFRASEREYQNFKISEMENGLQILLFPKRDWKRAQIDIQSFITYKDYVNLLKIFHESILELEIFDMDIEDVKCDNGVMSFDRLKKLTIGYVTAFALKPFLGNQPKLEKLIIENVSKFGVTEEENTEHRIVTLLTFQTQLTHLHLSSDAFRIAFADHQNFNFQLIYLLVEFHGSGENEESKILIRNFEVFLHTQKKLQWITLCEWRCSQMVSNILQLKIERLSFDYFDVELRKFDTSLVKLNQNHNIKQIDIECDNIELCWVKPIFEATPAVTTLYLSHVTEDILLYIISKLKHLKVLKYCSIFKNYGKFISEQKLKNISISRE